MTMDTAKNSKNNNDKTLNFVYELNDLTNQMIKMMDGYYLDIKDPNVRKIISELKDKINGARREAINKLPVS
jgi:hypothetical protein